jgi:hypothetical protein
MDDSQYSPDMKQNNNFYDDSETMHLSTGEITVSGEIENSGKVDLPNLPKHSVIVKETLLAEDGKDTFTGAYRYDGYSLFDILNDRVVKKANESGFDPVIDLYVEIENAEGEKVILSWGEIYYPNFLHNSILATDVTPIVPSKTKDIWVLPSQWKLVIANDLLTERNILNPVKITVRSYSRQITLNRQVDPLYSDRITFFEGDQEAGQLTSDPNLPLETVHTIFYGRGRGIHSTQPFTGYYLKDLLAKYIRLNKRNLREGFMAIVGKDGYRAVFSCSEILNRNDGADVLLVPCKEDKDGGRYRIFPSCDFFSDRAVKAVEKIYMVK